MKFFVDNNLPPVLAKILDAYLKAQHPDGKAIHLRERFPQDTPDIEWITELGKEEDDWYVFTADLRIFRNKAEKQAWRQSGLSAFVFKKGLAEKPLHLKLAQIFRLMEKIEARITHSRRATSTFLEELPASGDKLKPVT